jgi:hypothetical protein
MHNIDKVFRDNNHQYRKESISTSKLGKGDASFQDKKKCLGWDFGGCSKTLFVAAYRREKALTNLGVTLQKPWATLNEWQKLLGALYSLTPQACPKAEDSSHSCKRACGANETASRLPAWSERNWRPSSSSCSPPQGPLAWKSYYMANHATLELLMQLSLVWGGVWFPKNDKAYIWHAEFPTSIQRKLVSHSYPHGTIANSNLELAGTIAHHMVLMDAGFPVAGETTHTGYNNTPAVAWQTKGSTMTNRAAATLLQEAALHQREHGYLSTIDYLPGSRSPWQTMSAKNGNYRTPRFSPILITPLHRHTPGRCSLWSKKGFQR